MHSVQDFTAFLFIYLFCVVKKKMLDFAVVFFFSRICDAVCGVCLLFFVVVVENVSNMIFFSSLPFCRDQDD